MSTASQVVTYQAEILDQLRTPDPRHPGVTFEVTRAGGGGTGSGEQFRVPRSVMGNLIDLMHQRSHGDARPLHDDGVWSAPTIAPVVAAGLASARTYVVQENMSPAVAARADSLPRTVRVFDDVAPPRSNGFAWFNDTIPYAADRDPGGRGEPGMAAVSWAAVIDQDDAGAVDDVGWVVVVWDDLTRSRWDGHNWDDTKSRFVPITTVTVRAGERVGFGPAYGPAEFVESEAPLRSPLRIAVALWQMLGETVPAGDRAEQAGEPVDRRSMRRARRAGMTPPSEVTTVVLRRESRPTVNPGSGQPHTSRVWVEPYQAWRWVGPRTDRRRVLRTVAGHWSCGDESLPVRRNRIVSELRR